VPGTLERVGEAPQQTVRDRADAAGRGEVSIALHGGILTNGLPLCNRALRAIRSSADVSIAAEPRRGVLVAWVVMAVVNLSAGVVIASWPERQTDLETMRRWGRAWLVAGSNVYAVENEAVDYAPNAIVALSPLALLPERSAAPVWAGLNLLLAVIAPYLAVRAVRPAVTRSAAALPVLMFLCWGGFRTLLQFSLLALAMGLLAMILAPRRPWWSGICLGLALIKPQIGVPFLLWALFGRRQRVVAGAIGVVAGGFAVFCLRADVAILTLIPRYAEILQTLYSGDSRLVGVSELGPLIAVTAGNTASADIITGLVALSMLGAVCALGMRETTRNADVAYSLPALAGVWSLLTFRHLTYGFVLLLPAAALLLCANDPASAALRRRVFWALQFALMFDVPGLWRRFGHLLGAPSILGAAALHADRVLLLCLFVCLAVLSARAGHAAGGRLASAGSITLLPGPGRDSRCACGRPAGGRPVTGRSGGSAGRRRPWRRW
jgi:hypothetical protein